MRTRTHLTTPPGSEPTPDGGTHRDDERWSPTLAVPTEPRVPGRHRRLWSWLAGLAVLGVVGAAWFQLATRGQDVDPSLRSPVEATGDAPPEP